MLKSIYEAPSVKVLEVRANRMFLNSVVTGTAKDANVWSSDLDWDD